MKEKNPKMFINLNKALYETINSKNNKISLFNQNKQFVKNSSTKFLKVSTNNHQNIDEDDIKNNQNFNIFMKSLLKNDDDDNKEISKICSKNIFFRKKINLNSIKYYSNENQNNCLSSRNEKNKIYSIGFHSNKKIKNRTFNNGELIKNEINKKNTGLECKIFQKKKNQISRNNIFTLFESNTTIQEFDGKMLYKPNETKYLKKFNKRKTFNSFNSIRKIIPKNLITKIMFVPNNPKKEKENKAKLMAMKENVILFLKDKNSKINKNCETQNLINSYFYSREKKYLSLNKKLSHEAHNFPPAKPKSFYNVKDIIKNIKKSKIFFKNKVKSEKLDNSNNSKNNKYKLK